MSESDELMGELRSLFAQKPSKKTWEAVCETLERWPADELPRRDEEALPYCQGHMLTWGARINTRPPNAWFVRWFGGDPTVVELMGLGYLNSARAPTSKRSPRQRCSYYTIWTRDISWASNNLDTGDISELTLHTADRGALERAAWNSAQGMEIGANALWQHLSPDGHREQAVDEAKVTFVLNGVEIRHNMLMPDLTITHHGETLRLVAERPMALSTYLHAGKDCWHYALEDSIVRLIDGAGEQVWRGSLEDVGRAEPWREVLGQWFRPDPSTVSADNTPLLGELPPLPTFNRLPEDIQRVETRRVGC